MKCDKISRYITQMKKGDSSAFENLYQQTKRGVFAFLHTYLHNVSDSEDAMQTVYIKVKENCNSFADGTNGRAWLLQIAKNHALNIIAKNKREVGFECLENRSDGKEYFSDGTVTSVMEKVLSEEEQRIVTLHVIWLYKHREIAEILGVPTGTVTSKYKRSIEKLKKALKEEKV